MRKMVHYRYNNLITGVCIWLAVYEWGVLDFMVKVD